MSIIKPVRKYYKRTESETSWTQPVLSANGTIGGNAFACAASSTQSSQASTQPYKAFNGVYQTTSEGWFSRTGNYPAWLEWYNPLALKITNLKIYSGVDYGYSYGSNLGDFYIQVSDDNTNWETVYSGSNRSSGKALLTEINLSLNKRYKYWRLYCLNSVEEYTGVSTSGNVLVQEITITATQIAETITPGTPDDYDYYEDVNKEIDRVFHGSTEIDYVYHGSTLVFDRVPHQPVNPTFTTLATCGTGQTIEYTVDHKGYYYFYCVNHYEDSRRWGQAYINNVLIKQWNDYTDQRIGPYYLVPGDIIKMVEWGNSWTMTIYFQEGTDA